MVVMGEAGVGTVLEPIEKRLALDDMYAFERVVWDRGQNVHNDPALAESVGLRAPIASGMMQLAYIHELLERHFGEGWTRGGTISARWLHPVYAGDTLTVAGIVTAWGEQDGRPRATVEVSCTNQDGVRTAVATAGAYAR